MHNKRFGAIFVATLAASVNAQSLDATALGAPATGNALSGDAQSYTDPNFDCGDLRSVPIVPPGIPGADALQGVTEQAGAQSAQSQSGLEGAGTVLSQTTANEATSPNSDALNDASAGTDSCGYTPPSRPRNPSAAPSVSATPIIQNTNATVSVGSIGSGVTYEIYQRLNSGSYTRIHR